MPQKVSTPQNGSRGGVKFGVTEGGKGGGAKENFLHNRGPHKKICAFFAPFGHFFSKTLSEMSDFLPQRGGRIFFFEGSQFSALG